MRIPWIPMTQGGGAHGPVVLDTHYKTASDEVIYKRFGNTPMGVPLKELPIYKPQEAKVATKGTRVRTDVERVQVAYEDSYVTHPIPENYANLVASINAERAAQVEVPPDNLERLQHAMSAYRQLGASADDERTNEKVARLRYAGASEDMINEIIREEKKKRMIHEMSKELSHEQLQAIKNLPATPQFKPNFNERMLNPNFFGNSPQSFAPVPVLGTEGIEYSFIPKIGARTPQDVNVFAFPNPSPLTMGGGHLRRNIRPENLVSKSGLTHIPEPAEPLNIGDTVRIKENDLAHYTTRKYKLMANLRPGFDMRGGSSGRPPLLHLPPPLHRSGAGSGSSGSRAGTGSAGASPEFNHGSGAGTGSPGSAPKGKKH